MIVESLDRSFHTVDRTRTASKLHKTKTLVQSVHFVKYTNLTFLSSDVEVESRCEGTLRDADIEVGMHLINCIPGHT